MSEKEPKGGLERHDAEPSLGSKRKNQKTLDLPSPAQAVEKNKIELPTQLRQTEIPLQFIDLPSLVGKIVRIRDPKAQVDGPLDDPLFKAATVNQDSQGNLSVSIDRGRYYPYFTGDRAVTSPVRSQEDFNRLKISLQ